MEVLPRPSSVPLIHQKSVDFSRELSFDAQDGSIMWDAQAQGVNKKLMRLAVDSRSSSKRSSLLFDDSFPTTNKNHSIKIKNGTPSTDDPVASLKIRPLNEEESTRFPRIEEMSHFHYNNIEFDGKVNVSLCLDENEDISALDTGQALLVQVTCGDKSWVVKRSQEDFVGFDRQIHRCLHDRRYSQLPVLKDYDVTIKLTTNMVQEMQLYLTRFSEVAGNNVNCGPILNWLELDNHGNHLVVTEADDSAINVPAIAAGRVLKRYQAQAADEISLEVGDFLSVIDMPPAEETIWWRGKKGFEVGFFPSHCVEIIGVKEINDKIIAHLQSRPISKPRGKFISFLRFFFKSRPSKDELMQSGILRERVFGCDLGERLAHTGRNIPLVLEMCADVIEEHGIVDGIYRLSGIMSNLQSLRIAFDSDDEPPELTDLKYLHDIHCISSLLKTYFRELPNPLFTHELYDKFVSAIGKEDDTEKSVAFHHVIQRLPPPHYRTMNYLLRHLNYCANKAHETNMTAKNLAIVWAPNLLRPNSEDSIAALTEFRTQAIIVEYMIRNVDVFFDKNLASAAIAYYPELQDSQTEGSMAIARAATIAAGPKLISLEEARQRVLSHRQISDTLSLDSNSSSSPRHSKIRSSYQPPKVAATPISPLPSLLSIEEAQARTKSKFNRRGSADLVELRNNINSPKRTKKWFGLFMKAKSGSVSEDETVLKAPNVAHYRKKKDSSPSRSQSEYRLTDLVKRPSVGLGPRTSSVGNSIRERVSVSPTDNDEDFDRFKPSDGDDTSLMSAVVSVTAKYINVQNSRNKSFVIGEPQDFRRLGDSELHVAPPKSVYIKNDPPLLEQNVPEKSSAQIIRQYKERKSSNTNQKQIILSPERKHQRSSALHQEYEENIPVKKIRSLSPENYSKQPLKEKEETLHVSNTPVSDSQTVSDSLRVDNGFRHRNNSAERSFRLVTSPKSKQRFDTESQQTSSGVIPESPSLGNKSTSSKPLRPFDLRHNKKSYTRSYSTPVNNDVSISPVSPTNNESKFRLDRHNRHAASYNGPRNVQAPIEDATTLNKKKFAIRRLRSHSEEENALNSLAQHTENKIKAGRVEGLLIPKRDYNDENCDRSVTNLPTHNIVSGQNIIQNDLNVADVPSYNIVQDYPVKNSTNLLVKSTEERMDPQFTLLNSNGYVLKQRRIGATNLVLNSYGKPHDVAKTCDSSTDKPKYISSPVHSPTTHQPIISPSSPTAQKLDDIRSFDESNKYTYSNLTKDSRERHEINVSRYINTTEQSVEFQHEKEFSLKTIDSPVIPKHEFILTSKTLDKTSKDRIDTTNNETKEKPENRRRSVKERANYYNTPVDINIRSSQPELETNLTIVSKNKYERTRSSPNLSVKPTEYSGLRTSVRSSYQDEDLSKYESDLQNFSNQIYVNTPGNRHSSYSPGLHHLNIERNGSKVDNRSSSYDNVRGALTHSTDKLVASSYIRSGDFKSTPTCKQEKQQIRKSVSEMIQSYGSPNYVNNTTSNRNQSSVRPHNSPRPMSIGFSALDMRSHHASEYSLNTLRPQSNDMPRSHSDNRLADNEKQIGSFPLTLKHGSARDNRVKPRPKSMYDNNRGSYYDNVHSIHFEML